MHTRCAVVDIGVIKELVKGIISDIYHLYEYDYDNAKEIADIVINASKSKKIDLKRVEAK